MTLCPVGAVCSVHLPAPGTLRVPSGFLSPAILERDKINSGEDGRRREKMREREREGYEREWSVGREWGRGEERKREREVQTNNHNDKPGFSNLPQVRML